MNATPRLLGAEKSEHIPSRRGYTSFGQMLKGVVIPIVFTGLIIELSNCHFKKISNTSVMTSLFRSGAWPRVAALFTVCFVLHAGTCQHSAHRLQVNAPKNKKDTSEMTTQQGVAEVDFDDQGEACSPFDGMGRLRGGMHGGEDVKAGYICPGGDEEAHVADRGIHSFERMQRAIDRDITGNEGITTVKNLIKDGLRKDYKGRLAALKTAAYSPTVIEEASSLAQEAHFLGPEVIRWLLKIMKQLSEEQDLAKQDAVINALQCALSKLLFTSRYTEEILQELLQAGDAREIGYLDKNVLIALLKLAEEAPQHAKTVLTICSPDCYFVNLSCICSDSEIPKYAKLVLKILLEAEANTSTESENNPHDSDHTPEPSYDVCNVISSLVKAIYKDSQEMLCLLQESYKDEHLRVAALRLLRYLAAEAPQHAPTVSKLLLKACANTHPSTCMAAMYALNELLHSFTELASEVDLNTFFKILHNHNKVYSEDTRSIAIEIICSVIEAAPGLSSSNAIEMLFKIAKNTSESESLRSRTISTIGTLIEAAPKFSHNDVFRALIAFREEKSESICAQAGCTLGKLAIVAPSYVGRIFPILQKMLKDEDVSLYADVIEIFGKLAPVAPSHREVIFSILQNMVKHEDSDVCKESITALGELATVAHSYQEAISKILLEMAQRDGRDGVIASLRALAKLIIAAPSYAETVLPVFLKRINEKYSPAVLDELISTSGRAEAIFSILLKIAKGDFEHAVNKEVVTALANLVTTKPNHAEATLKVLLEIQIDYVHTEDFVYALTSLVRAKPTRAYLEAVLSKFIKEIPNRYYEVQEAIILGIVGLLSSVPDYAKDIYSALLDIEKCVANEMTKEYAREMRQEVKKDYTEDLIETSGHTQEIKNSNSRESERKTFGKKRKR